MDIPPKLDQNLNAPDTTSSLLLKTTLYTLEDDEDSLIIKRKFPPAEKIIKYQDIASAEFSRILSYTHLKEAILAGITAALFFYLDVVHMIIGQILRELNDAGLALDLDANWLSSTIGVLFLLLLSYHLTLFFLSLRKKVVIYRKGKPPLAVPLSENKQTMGVVERINSKASEGPLQQEKIEKIIGDKIRALLDQRLEAERKLISELQANIQAAKKAGDTKRIKKIVEEGITKLEARDELIDEELKKTGLKKEDLFKKYRIKPPKEEFIEDVLKLEGLEDMAHLLKKKP